MMPWKAVRSGGGEGGAGVGKLKAPERAKNLAIGMFLQLQEVALGGLGMTK